MPAASDFLLLEWKATFLHNGKHRNRHSKTYVSGSKYVCVWSQDESNPSSWFLRFHYRCCFSFLGQEFDCDGNWCCRNFSSQTALLCYLSYFVNVNVFGMEGLVAYSGHPEGHPIQDFIIYKVKLHFRPILMCLYWTGAALPFTKPTHMVVWKGIYEFLAEFFH